MDPWADFLISHVRYDEHRIAKVLAWRDAGATIAGGHQLPRAAMLELLRAGHTFMTIHRLAADASDWKPAAQVSLIELDGADYIRTDGQRTGQDHLGELSTF